MRLTWLETPLWAFQIKPIDSREAILLVSSRDDLPSRKSFASWRCVDTQFASLTFLCTPDKTWVQIYIVDHACDYDVIKANKTNCCKHTSYPIGTEQCCIVIIRSKLLWENHYNTEGVDVGMQWSTIKLTPYFFLKATNSWSLRSHGTWRGSFVAQINPSDSNLCARSGVMGVDS